jgi:hypothetical protein
MKNLKHNNIAMIVIAGIMALYFTSGAMAEDFPPTTTVGVTPTQITQVTGGPGNECAAVGTYAYAYKWNTGNGEGAPDGTEMATFQDGHSNTITISNSDGKIFDWSSTPNSIGAVLVKAGTLINIFKYDPQKNLDTDLYAPDNKDISHVTFCWNKDDSKTCYKTMTAWGNGDRYVKKGNWATYTPYEGVQNTVPFYAGQTIPAGTVTFTPAGDDVKITIDLNEGWIFAYGDEVGGLWAESLHIQGYDVKPLAQNPTPGLFANKYEAFGNLYEVIVPKANYYGVHAKVAQPVECPTTE